jgi:hypothetical protein
LYDQFEVIARAFNGFTLGDIKGMTVKERKNWIERSGRYR